MEPASSLQTRIAQGDSPDEVFVDSIRLKATIGLDCWQRPKAQDVLVSATVYQDTGAAAVEDDFTKTLDYRKIYKPVLERGEKTYVDVYEFMAGVVQKLGEATGNEGGRIEVSLPGALLRCDGGLKTECSFYRVLGNGPLKYRLEAGPITVKDIRLSCIIGINEAERVKRQPITLSLTAYLQGTSWPGEKDSRNSSQKWGNLPSFFDDLINVSEPVRCIMMIFTVVVGSGSLAISDS